jgi:hypothetical protein
MEETKALGAQVICKSTFPSTFPTLSPVAERPENLFSGWKVQGQLRHAVSQLEALQVKPSRNTQSNMF